MKDLNQWVREIHANAKEHGWWDDERSMGDIVALCHSELSEALEADRAGEPMVWDNDGKPDGVAVEMADCMIRIMDWFGHVNMDLDEIISEKHEYNKTRPYKHGKRY